MEREIGKKLLKKNEGRAKMDNKQGEEAEEEKEDEEEEEKLEERKEERKSGLGRGKAKIN